MRKLRTYKGVTFDVRVEDRPFCYARVWYESAAKVIATFPHSFTDDDHAALMDLKANPYEPTPTSREVVEEWLESSTQFASDGGYFIRASDIESLCARLREAFPHIDGEGV